jgi:O-antigen/teichoic acid export membrane protein
MLFFTALSSAETTILQSTHRLQYLAKASMIGAITGLVAGVPLYYCFGTKGIVPAMIILALVSFLTNSYFTQKMTIKHSSIPMREAVREGKHMFFLGSVMMISSLIGLLSTYILNIYIRTYGSLDDVGLYQAANSITNQYVGLVFTAMGIDYFPRLATVCKDNGKVREMVCDQLDVVMLIVTPLLILIILIAPLLVKLLLTDNFLPVIPLLRWFGLAIFFKALTYPVGYISFSKGDKKTFFWLEGIYTNFMILALSITGYRLWGINGLGIAMTIALVLYFIVLSIVVKIRYNFVMRYALLKTIIPLFLAVLGSFLICQLNPGNWKSYGLTTVILIAISFYSYKELDLRLDLRSIVQKLRNK